MRFASVYRNRDAPKYRNLPKFGDCHLFAALFATSVAAQRYQAGQHGGRYKQHGLAQ
jgi:hypothetical protein